MGYTDLTQQQIENIQIDHGIVYINYGEEDERLLGPTRGGGEFTATSTIRDIEYDGKRGKTKGMQVVEEQAATLKTTVLDYGQENILMAIPGAVEEADGSITNGSGGVIQSGDYLKNITMFAKTIGGSHKKVQIFNVMQEGAFTLKAAPKAEGELALEVNAHFDPTDGSEKIYKISDATTIEAAAARNTQEEG